MIAANEVRNLSDVLTGYVLSRDVSWAAAQHLRYALARYERFLGTTARTLDLDGELVNAWIAAMLAEGLSRHTVASYRGALLTIWRAAHQQHLIDAPDRVRPVRRPRLACEAWQPEEVAALAVAAGTIEGSFPSGIPRGPWLRAFVLAAWDSGLRLGDLERLAVREHTRDGVLQIVQHKTGTPLHWCWSPATLEAIHATLPPKRASIFGVLSRGKLWKWLRVAREIAGLDGTGSAQRIRRSGATAVERLMPGAAMRYLGHLTPGLAYRHYVDQRLLHHGVQPPPLPVGDWR